MKHNKQVARKLINGCFFFVSSSSRERESVRVRVRESERERDRPGKGGRESKTIAVKEH